MEGPTDTAASADPEDSPHKKARLETKAADFQLGYRVFDDWASGAEAELQRVSGRWRGNLYLNSLFENRSPRFF